MRRKKAMPAGGKRKFLIAANATITVHTVVWASTVQDAIEEATCRSMMGLCHQCASSDKEDRMWCTTGELDGEADEDAVVEVIEELPDGSTVEVPIEEWKT